MGTGYQNAISSVRTDFSSSFVGAILEDYTGRGEISVRNKDDEAADLWTVTVSSTGPTTIAFTDPAGTSETITIAASATAAALKAALEAHSTQSITRWCDLVATASTTMTAEVKHPGYTVSFSNTTYASWAHTTTGSIGSDIPMGRAVLKTAYGTMPGADRLLMVKACDGLTAPIVYTDTFSGTIGAGDRIRTLITMRPTGETIEVRTAYDTDEATTLTAHATTVSSAVDSMQGMVASGSLGAARSGSTIVYTGDEEGLIFQIVSEVENSASGTLAVSGAWTTPAANPAGNIAYDLERALAGIIHRQTRCTYDASGVPVLPAGKPGAIFRGPGVLTVYAAAGTPALGGRVYVGTTSSTAGKFAATPTDGYVPVSLDTMQWDGPAASGYAPVRILRALA